MQFLKMALAASVLVGGLSIAVPASARPGWNHHKRHQVCNTRWVHHHKVRRCHWA